MTRAARAARDRAQIAAERAAADADGTERSRALLLAGFDAGGVRPAGQRSGYTGGLRRGEIAQSAPGDKPLPLIPSRPDGPRAAKRPCSACGRQFQPTLRRRRLCDYCYREAGEGMG